MDKSVNIHEIDFSNMWTFLSRMSIGNRKISLNIFLSFNFHVEDVFHHKKSHRDNGFLLIDKVFDLKSLQSFI